MTNWEKNDFGLIDPKKPKQDRRYWEEKAKAALELIERYKNNPLLAYIPCCATHGGRKPDDFPLDKNWIPSRCPTFPCPDSKHHKFHQSRARIRLVLGGNRSSKTFTCAKEFLFRMTCKKHPFTGEVFRTGDRHGRVLAQDYAIHEKKHIPEIKEWMPKQALKFGKCETKQEAWEKSYDSRNHVLHMVNGGWIDFLTYDQDPSKGESVDLDAWFADEEIPEEWYSACNSRLITRAGVGILGVTPLYGLSWSMRLIDSTDSNVAVFKWSIWDNPYNTKKAIDDFVSQTPEHERDSRVDGTLMEFKGLRYKQLTPEAHLVDNAEPRASWPVICAVDPHQRKGTFVTWAYIDPSDVVTFFDELHIQGNVKEAVAKIREREATHKARTLLRLIDPAADKQVEGYGEDISTLDTFEKEGMSFLLAFNGRAGYDIVEEYLNYDKTKPLDGLNRPSCRFSRKCENTWYAMTRLLWDEYRASQRFSREPKERVKDKGKDYPDCVRYTLSHRPVFSSGNMSPVDLNISVEG
jgi:hypothetical protein